MLNLKVVTGVIVVFTYFISATSSQGVDELLLDSKKFNTNGKEEQLIELLYSAEIANRYEEMKIAIKELASIKDKQYSLTGTELTKLSNAYRTLLNWRQNSLEGIFEIIRKTDTAIDSEKDLAKMLMRVVMKELADPCKKSEVDAELFTSGLMYSLDYLMELIEIALKVERKEEVKLAMRQISLMEKCYTLERITFLHEVFEKLLKSGEDSLEKINKRLNGSSNYKATILTKMIIKVQKEQVDICQTYVELLDKTLNKQECGEKVEERFCYLIQKAKVLSTKQMISPEQGSQSQNTDEDVLNTALRIENSLSSTSDEDGLTDYWKCVKPVFDYYKKIHQKKACKLGKKVKNDTDELLKALEIKSPGFKKVLLGRSWNANYVDVEIKLNDWKTIC